MSYNGSGTFVINSAGQPVVTNTTISSTAFNALTADLATGLSTALTKDGQTTATANIPMGTKKLTGLGVGTANTDSITLGQSQAGGALFLTAAGTADVITATGAPTITAYATGNSYYFTATGANTTNVTLNVDGLGAKAVTKNGSTALVAGDIPSGAEAHVVYDGTRFQLINPSTVSNIYSMPQNSQSAAYTTVLGDAGKHIFHPSTDANARTFTIDSNANVAYTIGTIMRFENQSVNTLTLAITADTLTLEPGGTTGSIVIGTNDSVDVLKVGTTNWVARRTAARGLAVNSQSANYTTVLSDMGKFLLHPTADNIARTFTIDSNANVAYPVGQELNFVNQINTLTIAITSDTLTLSPDNTSGSVTLSAGQTAVAKKITSTLWLITKSASAPCLTLVKAYRSVATANVTGDATVYTVTWDTEEVDRASDFAASIFTCRATGLHRVTAYLSVYDMTVGMSYVEAKIEATGQQYDIYYYDPTGTTMMPDALGFSAVRDIYMTAGDTFTISVAVGGGAKVADLDGLKKWSGLGVEFLG